MMRLAIYADKTSKTLNFYKIQPSAFKQFFCAWLIPVALFTLSCATTTPANQKRVPESSVKEQALSKRNMGEAYIMQGNFTAALKELQAAENLNPKDHITHNYLGIAYKNKNLTDLAIKHFDAALELNPGYSIARNNLGTVYLDMKKWDEAITCFTDVINDILYTTPHYPMANLGWAYYNKKDFSTARKYYREALQIKSNFIIALNGLGQTYMAERKYQDAADMFERVVKYETRVPELYFQLAKAYDLINEKEKAVKAYLKVVELAPESDMAEEARKLVGQ